VLARLPNPRAKRVLVVSAHHDAPHSGATFHPGIARWLVQRFGPAKKQPPLLPQALGNLGVACAIADLSVRPCLRNRSTTLPLGARVDQLPAYEGHRHLQALVQGH